MKTLVIDFETKDVNLTKDGDGLGLGPGSRFALHSPDTGYKVLLAGYIDHTGSYSTTDDWCKLKEVILHHDVIVAHNAAYDFGCMLYLYGLDFHNEIRDKIIVDSVVLCKLYDNTHMVYSLDKMASKYNREFKKAKGSLTDAFFNCGLYKEVQEERTCRQCHLEEAPTDAKGKPTKLLTALTMQNLDLMLERDPESVHYYLEMDVKSNHELYWNLIVSDRVNVPFKREDAKGNQLSWEDYSNALKAMVVAAHRGCRVDSSKLEHAEKELKSKIDELEQEIYDVMGGDIFQISSHKQVVEKCQELDIELPLKQNANGDLVPTTAKDEIEDLPHPFFKLLVKYRNYNKLLSTTIMGIKQQIEYVGTNRCFYDIVLMGASQTGRYSSRNVNIQQIPKRDPYARKLCRGLFIPDAGMKWASCDFSNQEPRLQVHYAYLLGCAGAQEVVDLYRKAPDTSIHTYVAEKLGMTKAQTKPITLGLSYSMGEGKLCQTLGLSTNIITKEYKGKVYEIQIAGKEGKRILEMYYKAVPFLPALIKATRETFAKNGYLRLASGRKSWLKWKSEARKGLSKLIQGSAADQTTMALSMAYIEGLDILNTIHDEINIQFTNESECATLKACMENAFELEIPVIADLAIGDSWAEC
jgi:DNA polymerase III epsilon subunit-like protein